MLDVAKVQNAIREAGIDGWLLYDFRGTNALARRILSLDARGMGSRRLLYWIPVDGPPKKLVHRIEAAALDGLPGEKLVYLKWQEYEAGIAALVQGARTVAMEYSPRNAIPYISRVDAGTVELVASFGVKVVPSGDLIQQFEATWDDHQWQMHLEAVRHTDSAYARAWSFIAERVRRDGEVHETAVQQVILNHFADHGLICDHPPIVAVGPHSGDPHFETCPQTDAPIRRGDLVLIDLWGKLNQAGAVYSDLTRMGAVDTRAATVTPTIFAIVRQARDAAIDVVRKACQDGQDIRGWQVDDAARQVIEQAGYGASIHPPHRP